ncbi:Bax inhibitor-1/YccA family protein [Pseudoduganella sp. GCM10020061]|jgi:modulator of FtsH protease|uniref:Bax inhibitor-1/YccA family protein n=1 Tax=Pseudoduganella sp. GCM10020061 TaxID=3317345 RepID=UPI00363444C3
MFPTTNRPYDVSPTGEVVRNRVLRNTYWLLALSMIPTVLGAFVGVTTGFSLGGGFLGFAIFLAVMFGFIYVIQKNKDSGLGVVALLGFTFFMGLMLTPLLSRTLGYSNGGSLIMTAFGGTGLVFVALASYATVTKRDFSMMGKWLFAGTIVVLLALVANIFLQMPVLHIVLSIVIIALFSAWILYDVQQIVNGGETNYISATLSLYINVYNIFTSMLSLLGLGGDRD